MDILQVLTRHFHIESSENSLVHSDQRDEAICGTLRSSPVTAYPEHIITAINHLAEGINDDGMSTENVVRHVLDKITPGLAAGQSGPRQVTPSRLRLIEKFKLFRTDTLAS
jgi:hypothetical protein